jgi:hypothetical protein
MNRQQEAADRTFRQQVAQIAFLERRAIKTGEWPPFRSQPAPPELAARATPGGWLCQVTTIHTNGFISVLERPVQTVWGAVVHLAMRRASETDMPWAMKYRVFREVVADPDRMAIEVFPAERLLVDGAKGMYHLFVLPPDFGLPFGIAGEEGGGI